jgi:hypothetical protein
MSMTPAPASVPTWRQHLVALFVTFHIICVSLSALPNPPGLDNATLAQPEVRAELDDAATRVHNWIAWRDTPREQMDDLLVVARGYKRFADAAQARAATYLDLIDSTQSWHMFGGTPPRFPLVVLVEVRPENEKDFILFQDLRWGTSDSSAMNFRHRKVHENLYFHEGMSVGTIYAAYWARRWDAAHPERPAKVVRLVYLKLTTPSPDEVRAGKADRHPVRVQEFEWVRP